MTQRLRPGIAGPVFLMFSCRQVETGDINEPLGFSRSLTADPQAALDYSGRISLVVNGYNDDPAKSSRSRSSGRSSMVSTRSGPVRRRPDSDFYRASDPGNPSAAPASVSRL
jgi:hypothetical protein